MNTPGISALPPLTKEELDDFEARTGLAIPRSVRNFYLKCGGARIERLSLRLLSLPEARRLLDSWPRYGFEPGYFPIAEDRNGDLYCVRYAGGDHGAVFHLVWAGGDERKFGDFDGFLRSLLEGGHSALYG